MFVNGVVGEQRLTRVVIIVVLFAFLGSQLHRQALCYSTL